MRREALTLVAAMFLSTILMAACDKPGKPDTGKSAPPAPAPASAPPASPSATPSPPPPVAPSATENKDGTPPVQGQVDPKEPAQKKDFQPSK